MKSRLIYTVCAGASLLLFALGAPRSSRAQELKKEVALLEGVVLDSLVEAAIKEKLDSWKARRASECRKRALKIAAARADSMMVEHVRQLRMDADRPEKPERPEEPELVRPPDTLRLEPFVKE